MEMWDDGDSGGVSAVKLQQMMRGSSGKINGKRKARKNGGGGDVGGNASG